MFDSVTIDDFFVSGVLVDVGTDASQFVTGQLFGLSDAEDPIKFVGGQTEDGSFVPGQTVKGVFYPGWFLVFSFLVLSFCSFQLYLKMKYGLLWF